MTKSHSSGRVPPDIIITSSPTDSECATIPSTSESTVQSLVSGLASTSSVETQRECAAQLRLLAKDSMENRIMIGTSGAISLLIDLLSSSDPLTQEQAVTALLNISINDNNKTIMMETGIIMPLISVLKTGSTEAKENSAATLYSLSRFEQNRIHIGNLGAIPPLVELMENGTPLGKKDAITALYNLSTSSENKLRIVKAGAVTHLVELMSGVSGLADKATAALLANLSSMSEGRTAIDEAGGIPALVEIVELGSPKGKEFAVSALFHLCSNSVKYCNSAIKEDVVPPLMALLRCGTPRAREKAKRILEVLRGYRLGQTKMT